MKKMILFIMFFMLCQGAALAHPPASQELKYTPDGVLQVITIHGVQDPKSHYVYKYIVSVNGKEVKNEELKEQTDAEKEVISIPLPGLAKGSVISVTAECNKFGQLQTSITIE